MFFNQFPRPYVPTFQLGIAWCLIPGWTAGRHWGEEHRDAVGYTLHQGYILITWLIPVDVDSEDLMEAYLPPTDGVLVVFDFEGIGPFLVHFESWAPVVRIFPCIFLMAAGSVVKFYNAFSIPIICVFFFIFVGLFRGLSISLTFFKNQLWLHWCSLWVYFALIFVACIGGDLDYWFENFLTSVYPFWR